MLTCPQTRKGLQQRCIFASLLCECVCLAGCVFSALVIVAGRRGQQRGFRVGVQSLRLVATISEHGNNTSATNRRGNCDYTRVCSALPPLPPPSTPCSTAAVVVLAIANRFIMWPVSCSKGFECWLRLFVLFLWLHLHLNINTCAAFGRLADKLLFKCTVSLQL